MKTEKLIPEVYYKESRDFAYIGRSLDIIFNYMKTGADCVKVMPYSEYVDNTILDLYADTLGFKTKHEYIRKDLVAVIGYFISLVKSKGTITSINTAVKLLLNSQGIKKELDTFVEKDLEDPDTLIINLPFELTDIVLLEDIFDYILPSGTLYTIRKVNVSDTKSTSKILEFDSDRSNAELASSAKTGVIASSTIASGLNPMLGEITTGTIAIENLTDNK